MKKNHFTLLSVVLFSLFFNISAKNNTETLKEKILSNADLSGESLKELLSDDYADDDDCEEIEETKRAEYKRDVPFTPEMYDFIENYFNRNITTEDELSAYYNKALSAGESIYEDEYSKLINKARCNYFYGMQLMSTFDLSNIENTDFTSDAESEALNEIAGCYYDTAIEYAEKALEIKNGSDAWTILSHSISANCTAKNSKYMLANALKVRSYAKKACKLDPKNGSARFLITAQDIYAPYPFCKLNKGRKEMLSYLSNSSLHLEKYDRFNINCAVAYSWYKKKKYSKSLSWYKKCREIYPNNYSVNMMIEKIENK